MGRVINVLILLALVLVIGGLVRFLAQDRQREGHVGIARIAAAMAGAQGIKLRIKQYYHEHGQLPDSNASLGLPAPADLRQGGASSIAVEQEGTIHLTFAADNPEGLGHLFLVPDFADFYGGDRWLCITPSYPHIERWLPQCSYRPLDKSG
jgi:hypothetical protein